ncbi:carotenoid cleavage dioxygenase 1 [Xylariaceae sp. FL1272]|nr:carotenoid cleavage dioxygenase 1 [Xylariaceae sp. FL1272]
MASVTGRAEEEFNRVVKTTLATQWQDWPNEAGFEGLTEVRGPVDLKVTGSIPYWATGSLYRTGPGQYDVENTPKGLFKTTHWFDGFAHTHKFTIIATGNPKTPTRVVYSSRYQSHDYVEAIRKTGKVPGLSFGQRQDPCVGLFAKVMSVWNYENPNPTPSSDNIAVAVFEDMPGLPPPPNYSGHRPPMAITTDNSIIRQFDGDTLEPVGRAKQDVLHPDLKGPLSSAHAHRDPETGDFFNYNLDPGMYATYRVFKTSESTGKTEIIATIAQSDVAPAYIHSFFMSQSFVILVVPSTHLACKGLAVPWKGNIVDALEPFSTSKLWKWFVVDRRHGRGVVATFSSPAGFFFHTINAFEERDPHTGDIKVSCDVIEYPTLSKIRSFEIETLLQNKDGDESYWKDEERVRECLSRLTRYTFQVPQNQTGTAKNIKFERDTLLQAPNAGELPTINPAYSTRKYRYAYSLPTRGYSALHDGIVKMDLDARRTIFWNSPKGHTPGEPIFVPRPAHLHRSGRDEDTETHPHYEDEDDGVLLSVVLDGYKKTSYLLCLDAKTMKELGRANCEWAIGHGFHGLHKPGTGPQK